MLVMILYNADGIAFVYAYCLLRDHLTSRQSRYN